MLAIGWGVFWLGWLAAALRTKRGRHPWGREVRIRVVLIALIVILARVGVFRNHGGLHSDHARLAIGLVLFGAGLLFAVWARVHIGRNWGTPMSRKDAPELVTGGPYHLVRHPIYTGIITAGIGTAVALSWLGLIFVGLAATYFIYAATVEERFLAGEFPETYPAYKRSTKMLVPFVL